MKRSGKRTYPALARTLIAMADQDDVILVYRAFVRFTGSLEAGMMLGQLLYWTPRADDPDGWVYKSDKEWEDELCLTRYSVRAARKTLEGLGFLSTKRRRANGAPTTHYRLDFDLLIEKWAEFIQADPEEAASRLSEIGQSNVRKRTMENPKTDSPLSENGQSITETTTEITDTESETPPPAPTQPSRSHQLLPTPTQQNGTERRASQSRPPGGVGESDSGSRHTYTKEWKELARAVAAVCGYDPDKKVRSQKIRQQMRDACEALWEMGKRADDVNEWYETYWRSEKLNRGRCETYPYPAQVADEINRARPRRTPQEHTRRNPDTGEPERWDGYRWVIYGG